MEEKVKATGNRKRSLRTKLTLFILLAVLVPSVALTGISAFSTTDLGKKQVKEYKDQLTEEKKSELKNETQIAVSVIEQYHKLQEDGKMTEDEAKKAAADTVREMRYDDGNGYFWIDTSKGVNVVLLGRDTEGKSRWDAQDKTGRYYIQEMIKNGQKEGGGYTNLNFPKPNETEELPKINYTVTYKPYDWVLGTGVWVDDIDKLAVTYQQDTDRQIRSAFLGMTAAALILAVILIIAFSFPVKKICDVIMNVSIAMKHIASGDLTVLEQASDDIKKQQAVYSERNDELGTLASGMGNLLSELRKLLKKIHEMTDYLATSSQQLKDSARQSADASDLVANSITNVAQSCSSQSDVVNSAGNQTDEFSQDMQDFTDKLSASSEQINETTQAADEGRAQVKEAVAKIQEIQEAVENTSQAVSELGAQIGDIGDIVTDIQDIASQTNLLSLNASIEAARAGEAGKGFAVVAGEIQSLSQQSSDSAGRISDKISAIQEQSDRAVAAMQAGLDSVKGGAGAVKGAGKAFEGIADMIEKVNSASQQMKTIVDSLSEGTEQIKNAFANIKSSSDSVGTETENVSAASEEQSASMQEIAEAASKLSEAATELESAVAIFKL